MRLSCALLVMAGLGTGYEENGSHEWGQLVIGRPSPLVLHTHVPLAFSYMPRQLSEHTL